MDNGLENTLEVFKNRDPRMSQYANGNEERILFWGGECMIGYCSFTPSSISRMFENGTEDSGIRWRAIVMMEALQRGYHSGVYPGTMSRYPYHAEEYPGKYEALIAGLSDEALDIIADFDLSEHPSVPADLGEKFVTTLLDDARDMEQEPDVHIVEEGIPALLAG